MFEICEGLTQSALVSLWPTIKKTSQTYKFHQKLKRKQKNYKGFNQWEFVPLGSTLLFTTEKWK